MKAIKKMSIGDKFELLPPEEQQEVLSLVCALAQRHQRDSQPASAHQG